MLQTVLKIDLNLSPFKKRKAHVLSQTVKAKRLSRAKLLLEKMMDGRQPPVLWTDKKLFTVQAIHNHQNDLIYAVNKEDIPLNVRIAYKRQKSASVLVWAGVNSAGEETPLILIEEGVKINQHVYLSMLKEQLFLGSMQHLRSLVLLSNKMGPHPTFKESGVTLQQDRATSHTANLVQEWFSKHTAGFWTKELWPPSPDLNPIDSGVWGILESNACSSYYPSVASLKAKLKHC